MNSNGAGNDISHIRSLAEHHPAMIGENQTGENAMSGTDKFSERIVFLTRALVKNNVIRYPVYSVLLTIEYLCMMYYVLRVVDNPTINKGFSGIETFMNVEL